MPNGGSCLLGSINLSQFVTQEKKFNYSDFRKTVSIAVKALNDVLDEGLPLHPLQVQRDSVRDWRQIGLGIFGLSDMLIKMGIRYGCTESLELCDKIGFTMADMAIGTSALLAKECGTYPKYNEDAILKSDYLLKNATQGTIYLVNQYGLRNSQLLTCAPTGTLSSMLGVSGGIEPIFANYYTRKTESLHGHDEYYKVYTPIAKEYMEEHNLKDDSMLPEYFVTAQDLDYKERIDMQSVWQTHIDASISSTVNVSNDFTVEQVEQLYLYAWEKGLKGVTIFRDGCKRAGILTTSATESNVEKTEDNSEPKTCYMEGTLNLPKQLERGMIIKADDNCIGKLRILQTGCGTLHCCAYFDPITGELISTYLSKGSHGGCVSLLTGLSRMISISARGGIDIYTIADQLFSVGSCPSYTSRRAKYGDTSKGSSCPTAVGYAFLEMYEEMQHEINDDAEEIEMKPIKIEAKESKKDTKVEVAKPKCPECGAELFYEGGCNFCRNCGYSKCD